MLNFFPFPKFVFFCQNFDHLGINVWDGQNSGDAKCLFLPACSTGLGFITVKIYWIILLTNLLVYITNGFKTIDKCSVCLLFRVSRIMAWMCFTVPTALICLCTYFHLNYFRIFTKDSGGNSVSISINFTGINGAHNILDYLTALIYVLSLGDRSLLSHWCSTVTFLISKCRCVFPILNVWFLI